MIPIFNYFKFYLGKGCLLLPGSGIFCTFGIQRITLIILKTATSLFSFGLWIFRKNSKKNFLNCGNVALDL